MSSATDSFDTTSVPCAALRYEPAFEVFEKDEAETNADMIRTMRKIQQTVYDDSGHAERAVHAKSHGLLRGELQIKNALPPVLAQGFFAASGTYPIVLRFSTIPGDVLDDSVSVPRGLALKIVGVPGRDCLDPSKRTLRIFFS